MTRLFLPCLLRTVLYAVIYSSLYTTIIAEEQVTDIKKCKAFPARTTTPDNVRDLQISDIKVVAGLGDSIMTGLLVLAKDDSGDSLGIGKIDTDSITEYRGRSYAVGGDKNATTFPNFIKHYNADLRGASVGQHLITFCYAEFCPQILYKPRLDKLNAARSGAIAANLDDQLDYLLKQMKKIPGVNYLNDWKIITVNIGSNDQCHACSLLHGAHLVTVEKYASYVEAAVERIRKNVPRVIVNLVGNFKVSQAYQFSKKAETSNYCTPFLGFVQTQKILCECFLGPDKNRAKMDELADGYNAVLQRISNKYKARAYEDFAVLYQPANIDVRSFPMHGINNVDCFHPAVAIHEWFAKILWNGLFLPESAKPTSFEYDSKMPIYCPDEGDRIMIH